MVGADGPTELWRSPKKYYNLQAEMASKNRAWINGEWLAFLSRMTIYFSTELPILMSIVDGIRLASLEGNKMTQSKSFRKIFNAPIQSGKKQPS